MGKLPTRLLLQDGGGPSNELVEAHGLLMALTFVVILPISVVIAATMRVTWGPTAWLQAHRALNAIGAAAIVAGTVLGIIAYQQSQPGIPNPLYAHMVIGALAFALVIVQVFLALFARPSKESKHRRLWTPTHHNTGRFVMLLGFANAIIGWYVAGSDNSWYYWMCIVWVAILAAGAGKSLWNRRRSSLAAGKAPTGAKAAAPAQAKTVDSAPAV